MFHHIVLYKLKNPSETAQELKRRFLEMPLIIKEISEIKVGIDELHTGRSYDVSLYVKFDNREDLDSYKNNPFHLSVADYVHSVTETSVSVDYFD